MKKLSPDELIERVEFFGDWEDVDRFLKFRSEMFDAYDALSEEEQEYVDESMVMEQISMIYTCYEEIGEVNG